MADVFGDAQVKYCGIVETVAHPALGDVHLLSSPLRVDSIGAKTIRLPPPLLGQHTDEVLGDYGLSPDRIDALKRAKVVRTHGGDA